jgi:hypothetical protein
MLKCVKNPDSPLIANWSPTINFPVVVWATNRLVLIVNGFHNYGFLLAPVNGNAVTGEGLLNSGSFKEAKEIIKMYTD